MIPPHGLPNVAPRPQSDIRYSKRIRVAANFHRRVIINDEPHLQCHYHDCDYVWPTPVTANILDGASPDELYELHRWQSFFCPAHFAMVASFVRAFPNHAYALMCQSCAHINTPERQVQSHEAGDESIVLCSHCYYQPETIIQRDCVSERAQSAKKKRERRARAEAAAAASPPAGG